MENRMKIVQILILFNFPSLLTKYIFFNLWSTNNGMF